MANTIIACVNAFNEVQGIVPALRSIMPYVDEVILVDGSYLEYPTKDDYSTDGTVQAARYVVQKEWNKLFTEISFHDRKTEVQKRTAYLQYIQKNRDWSKTWAFIWDTDFLLQPVNGLTEKQVLADFMVLRETDDIKLASINLQNPNSAISNMMVGYRDIEGLHYARNHFGLWDSHDGAVTGSYAKLYHMNSSLVIHDRSTEKERTEARATYYNNVRLKYEV
jgi:hypothetical protein